MFSKAIEQFMTGFSQNQHHEPLNPELPKDVKISQFKLMQEINNQFQDLNIRRLMHNPKYNYRTSWIILGSMQNKADDECKEFNLDRTIDGLNEYLNVNKYSVRKQMYDKCTCGGDHYRKHESPEGSKEADEFIACYECGNVIVEGSDKVDKWVDGYKNQDRDINKLIRDTINNLSESGITKISDTIIEVEKAGITEDRATSYINQMKREGSVFEPLAGYLKCV